MQSFGFRLPAAVSDNASHADCRCGAGIKKTAMSIVLCQDLTAARQILRLDCRRAFLACRTRGGQARRLAPPLCNSIGAIAEARPDMLGCFKNVMWDGRRLADYQNQGADERPYREVAAA